MLNYYGLKGFLSKLVEFAKKFNALKICNLNLMCSVWASNTQPFYSVTLRPCLNVFFLCQPPLIAKLPTMSVYAGRDERGGYLTLFVKTFSFLSVFFCVLQYFVQNTTHTIIDKTAVQTYRYKNKIPHIFFMFLRKFTILSTCSCV